jgi:hypothetical protein
MPVNAKIIAQSRVGQLHNTLFNQLSSDCVAHNNLEKKNDECMCVRYELFDISRARESFYLRERLELFLEQRIFVDFE